MGKMSLFIQIPLFIIGLIFLILIITLLGAFMNGAGISNWFVKFAKVIDIFHFIGDGVTPNLDKFAKAIDIFKLLG